MIQKDLKYLLLITVIILLAYAQLTFGVFTTKWDNLSAFFPYRYTASHWINNGHLPLWDPYQNLGYPMHANPQGGTWNPLVWLVSLFTTYTPYIMNLEVVSYVLLAGLGFYLLFRELRFKELTSTIVAIAFALSGFTSGTIHMIGFTAAAGLLPWCILFFIRLLRRPKLQNSILLSIFIWFHLVAAYPAFSINLIYLLLTILLYYMIYKKSYKVHNYTVNLILFLILSACFTLGLVSPFAYSIYDSFTYFARSNPLDYTADTFANNFSWESFKTFFTPYIILSSPGIKDCDVSLTNTFIGVIPFLLSIMGITKYGYKYLYLLLAILLAYALALGNYTPIHKLCFYGIPGFAHFRHPYLFTLYGIIILLFFSAKGFEHLIEKSKNLAIFTKPILTIAVITIIITIVNTNWGNIQSYLFEIHKLQERTSLNNYGHATIQLFIIYLSVIFFYYLYKRNKKRLLWIPIVFEMILAVQLNGPLNMYYNVPMEQINEDFNKLKNINLTNQSSYNSLLSLSNDSIEKFPGFWVNLNTYQRTLGVDGYNPFILKSFDRFNSTNTFTNEMRQGLVISKSRNVNNLEIAFNGLSFKNNESQPITLNHNYHHNWKAFSQGNPIPISRDQYGRIFLSQCNPGKIELVYKSSVIKKLTIISWLVLLIQLLILFWLKVTSKPSIRDLFFNFNKKMK